MYDVIIIGGGPAGSHVAARLAGGGRRVMVLERQPAIAGKASCTGIIGLECAESFAIPEKAVLRRVRSARLYSPEGKSLHVRREDPQACVLDRQVFDRAMAERAQQNGAAYSFGNLVRDITITSNGVEVKASCPEKRQTFTARAVVIATGFGSNLTAKLGLGKCGDFALGGQAEVVTSVTEVEVYFGQDIAPGFFAWLVPTAAGRARVGLLTRRNPKLYLRQLLLSLEAAGKISPAHSVLSYGGIPLRPPRQTCGERVLVVGDAAGQVKPTTGGGIYYGLLGADIAAATLCRALEADDLSANSLAEYERSWRRKLGGELRTGYWARRFFEKLNDKQLNRFFNFLENHGILDALLRAEDISFDWHSKVILRLLKQTLLSAVGGLRLN